MRRIGVVLAAASLVALVASTLVGHAAPASPCGTAMAAAIARPSSSAALGRGLEVAIDGRLAAIDEGETVQTYAPPVGSGRGDVVRHVASRAGFGTAYVLDRRGPDVIVIDTPGGTVELPQPGEALHPAWSDGGDLVWSLGSSLRVRSHVDASVTEIPAPRPGVLLFAPVFTAPRRIVVVVSAAPTRVVPEDDSLDNLWSYDLNVRRWSALTAFRASADRWSVIRTPVVTGSGVVEFVRVVGSASATEAPSFSLWRLHGASVGEVRPLPGERYLASSDGATHVWNVPDVRSGGWRLVREDENGRSVDVGCGAVMVDPRDRPDPDREPARANAQPKPSPTTSPMPAPDGDDPEIAILVGDFSSRDVARSAVDRIATAYGPGATVEVVDSSTAPGAVRPGVWAAILRLPPDADPQRALADFRARLPEYADWSWAVTP
jgi:hypothetical protein